MKSGVCMFVWTSCSVTSEAAPGLGMDHVGNDTESVIVSEKRQKKATSRIRLPFVLNRRERRKQSIPEIRQRNWGSGIAEGISITIPLPPPVLSLPKGFICLKKSVMNNY